jgi:hypothetical protein
MIPIMVATPIKSGPQKGAMMETYMSDYQEVQDDKIESIMMPYFMEVKFNGQSIQKITIEEVTLNPDDVKPEMFSMPKDN